MSPAFDRDAATARVEGTVDVGVREEHDRFDRAGVRESDRRDGLVPVRFTCETQSGRVVALHLDRR